MSVIDKQDEIIKQFEGLEDWEDRYKEIIKIGKELLEFPDELKTEKNMLHGCQSQVWILSEFIDGKLYFKADSYALIVKGLIGMLIKVYSGTEPDEILDNPPDFLQKLGIDKHLSPTRSNGLAAMIKQIKMFAIAYKTLNLKKQF